MRNNRHLTTTWLLWIGYQAWAIHPEEIPLWHLLAEAAWVCLCCSVNHAMARRMIGGTDATR